MAIIKPSRRELLAALAGAPFALAAGCSANSPRRELTGEIVGASAERGHQVRRDAPVDLPPGALRKVGVVIVGGGIAGLSAAWRLLAAAYHDFVLLELEAEVGGTARAGSSAVTSYPWGAHYLPAPLGENRPLVALLDEMGVVEGQTATGEPVFAEQHLCRDPDQRLFIDGAWHEDLISPATSTSEQWSEWKRFLKEVDGWVSWRDAQGRRAFSIPADTGSDDAEVVALDRLTMANWLDEHGFHLPRVRWIIDYACRDDYGATVEQTSAWAGLFYFAARVSAPGAPAQPLLTWPEGNGRLVSHLRTKAADKIRTGVVALEIAPAGPENPARVATGPDAVGVRVVGRDAATDQLLGWQAERVIFAAPQFVAPHVVLGYRQARGAFAAEFTYGAWLVANLHLHDRTKDKGFALAWDNVLYGSPGLGYVVATHQSGRDYGPTVLTYYFPFCDDNPALARQRLYAMTWSDCAELVLSDLERAHPDLRSVVDRLDVMRWGHAMVRPRPGFRFGAARQVCQQPFGSVHFAHSDLSGLSLFEEAFHHGNRAADEVLAAGIRAELIGLSMSTSEATITARGTAADPPCRSPAVARFARGRSGCVRRQCARLAAAACHRLAVGPARHGDT